MAKALSLVTVSPAYGACNCRWTPGPDVVGAPVPEGYMMPPAWFRGDAPAGLEAQATLHNLPKFYFNLALIAKPRPKTQPLSPLGESLLRLEAALELMQAEGLRPFICRPLPSHATRCPGGH